jgi:phage terminase Nu1 subunit (DNA packaging protein)
MEETFTTIDTLASLFNMTTRRVQQLADDGVVKREGKGQYLLKSSIEGYIQFLQNSLHTKNAVKSSSLQEEELAIKRAKREQLEIKNAILRKDLINASDVSYAWENSCHFIKTRILSVPNKLAPHFKKKLTQKEAVNLITDALKGELNGISETEIELTDHD